MNLMYFSYFKRFCGELSNKIQNLPSKDNECYAAKNIKSTNDHCFNCLKPKHFGSVRKQQLSNVQNLRNVTKTIRQ